MNMCQQHWDRLREKIGERGLSRLVAPDGETAAAQMADQFRRGDADPTPANFDPLMSAFWAIGSNVMSKLGPSGLYVLRGPDAEQDPIDFTQYPNGEATRNRLALIGEPLTWPTCGLCYLNLAHELTCTEERCELPKVDGYDMWLDRAVGGSLEQAVKLGLVAA